MIITKQFVRFVVPALLTAALCALGASPVYAAQHCSTTNNKKTTFCFTWDDNDPKDNGNLIICDKHKNGTWSCTMEKTENNLPRNLKDAISKAQDAAKQQQISKPQDQQISKP